MKTEVAAYKSLRRADAPLSSGTRKLDHALFTGSWIATDSESSGIAKVRMAGTDGGVEIQIYGADRAHGLDWGVVAADTVYGANLSSHTGMAFVARYQFGFATVELQGNVNLGLLVLASFNSFRDGSKRSDYFGREFFYQADDRAPDFRSVQAASLPGYTRAEEIDASVSSTRLDTAPLIGEWKNTNPKSEGITRVEVKAAGDQLTIRCHGAGDAKQHDWGEIPARAFAKDPSSEDAMAFSAFYDHGFMQMHVQANIKQGVLVIAYFTIFRDESARSNYFTREFYYL